MIHGSSFIYTLSFTDSGPVADALLTYSQSGNPNSKHFDDQTCLYMQKCWRAVVFNAADVEAGTQSTLELRSVDEQ